MLCQDERGALRLGFMELHNCNIYYVGATNIIIAIIINSDQNDLNITSNNIIIPTHISKHFCCFFHIEFSCYNYIKDTTCKGIIFGNTNVSHHLKQLSLSFQQCIKTMKLEH